MNTLAAAPAEVNPAGLAAPELLDLDPFDDDDTWGDDDADEMAGLALAESRLEMGLMAW